MLRPILVLLLVLLPGISTCRAYSVLTHEAIIDSMWESEILPLLKLRFPNATPEELHKAHAYVYGGSLTQDMGYAPFSSRLMSDLTHYVRSGKFVEALLDESHTITEYAFALGALAHYAADSSGHPAINRITALAYPKLRARFGDVVTFEDKPVDHLKTEFALDVIQVARRLYAPDAYHDFVGFEVEQAALERAIAKTYGVEMKDLFFSEDLAIGTYRYSVGTLIPEATKVAWNSRRSDIQKLSPGIRRSKFIYALPRRQYRKEWGDKYNEPGIFARFLAFVFRLIPTFGPFKALGFRPIPAAGEQLFLESFDTTALNYQKLLHEVRDGKLNLTDRNLDTGEPTGAGKYRLADQTYVTLIDRLSKNHYASANAELRGDILNFFAHAEPSKISAKTARQLEDLRAAGRAAIGGLP